LDFEYKYSDEQNKFRSDVRDWLESNIPSEIDGLEEYSSMDEGLSDQIQIIKKKLGDMGWLAPSERPEYGGADMHPDKILVLVEELGERGLHWLLQGSTASLRNAIHFYGDQSQKDTFLKSMAMGEITIWHPNLEYGVSIERSDSVVRAYLDGDDYVLTGSDTFTGSRPNPDYIWVLATTDPDGSKDQTACFLVPSNYDGIEFEASDSLVENEGNIVHFEDVWVPSSCLIGDEGDGWEIMQSTLFSYPSFSYPNAKDRDVSDLIKYASETNRYGDALIKQTFFQQLLMEVYTNSELIRILKTRNNWMAETGKEITYETAQVALLEKKAALRLSQVVRDIMGMYALLDGNDKNSSFKGKFHMQQRRSVLVQNSTAGPEVQSEVIATQLGLGSRAKNEDYHNTDDKNAGINL
tara:strand:- start:298 stop:1527 length:1230 start_codon:yes stop_codon:yes gene_type:complete